MAPKPTTNDFKEHERTYEGFIFFGKWAAIVLALTMVLLYFVIKP